MNDSKATSLPDGERLKQVASYHGLRVMAYLSAFAALDAWHVVTDLSVAYILSIVMALILGNYLTSIFHEWGHFLGARVVRSRSPMVRQPDGIFIFGFNMEKNSTNQFLGMSLGGPIGNLLLIILVYTLLPMDSAAYIALFAMVVGKLISVIIFEGPIIIDAMNGAEPQAALDKQLNNGSQDKGQVLGYLVTIILWVVLV